MGNRLWDHESSIDPVVCPRIPIDSRSGWRPSHDFGSRTKEYRLQQEKASRLYEKLAEMLPEAGRGMLLQYSEALGAAHYLKVSMLAERAFLDGVSLILRAVRMGGGDGLPR